MTTASTTAIFYPETDGMPLPDGELQAPLYRAAVGRLEVHFMETPGAHVNGNTLMYYVEGDRDKVLSPDCYVVFGLSDAELYSLSVEGNNTYLLWEVGKPPDFVLEIGSPSTGSRDRGAKRDLYAQIGVPEYWRYDSSGGDYYGEPLVGERLEDGEYRRFELRHERDGSVWSHSPALNLALWWVDGELRFWDPVAEKWLPNHEEERYARRSAEAWAAQERDARLAERHARLAAEARVAEERDARLAERDARLAAEARAAVERDAWLAERDARLAVEAELRRLRGQ